MEENGLENTKYGKDQGRGKNGRGGGGRPGWEKPAGKRSGTKDLSKNIGGNDLAPL